ncbi:hypothetical protein RUND412_009600 [Rhizina undulata]
MSPDGSLPQSVVSIFKEHEPKSGTMQLSESQNLIASLAENFVQTIIVIDALDECDKEFRKQLLDSLDIILKASAGVIKFFVTSRDADDIFLKLEAAPNVYIHSRDNSGDIAAFVRTKVEKCISEKTLLRGSVSNEMKESVIETLTNGADGTICDQKTPKAIEKALQRLPKGLKGTYSGIWEKISDQSEENQLLATRTLKWIMCAQSPLAGAEIIEAVAIESMDFTGEQDYGVLKVQDLLDVCHNLIVMDEQLRVLRTAHFSVKEFLESHFKISEAHNQAAEICLNLMRRPKIYDEPPMLRPRFASWHWELIELTPRPEIYDEPHPLRYYTLLELQKEFFNASPAYYAWLQEAERRAEIFQPMTPEEKLTPLWTASYYGLSDICRNLLNRNADNYNVRNKKGDTPLYVAAYYENEEIVKLLLEKEGVDINSKNEDGNTPLLTAAGRGT